MPAELQGRPEVTPHEFWLALAGDPYAHLAHHWAWVAAGLFGLAAVPAISALVWPANRGAVLWAGSGAWLGFAVNARSHLMEIAFDRKIIPAYADADPAFQQAVHVVAGLALDVPDGFLTYGVVGVWVAVVSGLGLRSGQLPASALFSRLRERRGLLGRPARIPTSLACAAGGVHRRRWAADRAALVRLARADPASKRRSNVLTF
jgi:hypothetical protein